MSDLAETPAVLVLVRDLMLGSRVTATAKALGVPYRMVRDPAAPLDPAARRLVADLNLPGAIEAAAAWQKSTGKAAIGFVSHVDRETIERARAAGIDRVMARSRFVEMLEQVLAGEESII